MLSLLVRALLCATMLGAVAWWQRPDGRLHIIFLDTAGDAVLIQTPRGDFVLIDGGADPAALATLIGRRMPFWQHALGAVVLTAPDNARLPGQVAALARYDAALALAPPALPQNALVREWLRLLSDQRTPVRNARPGARLDIGGATIRVLAAGDDTGIALIISYGRTSVLLDPTGATTDAPPEVRPISALAYPWELALPADLAAAWQPRAIVFTTGYGADEPPLLTMNERAVGGAAVYHPKLNGTIELVSDGRRLWINTER